MAHTTTDSDENPLSDVKAADVDPCLDPGQTDHSLKSTSIHPLEKYQACSNFDGVNKGNSFDTRYTRQREIGQNEYSV
jgi:hypothetical protein